MAISITYTEVANSMTGEMYITDPDDPNKKTHIHIPKFMYDLIKPAIDAGTLDLQVLWDRTQSVSKVLPTA